jgi:hypothetical protein
MMRLKARLLDEVRVYAEGLGIGEIVGFIDARLGQ